MRPIAPETDWIQPPMCGWWSSRARGEAFSSAPGMLLCPRLSAPPRLPPAPPALLPEAAWYIASLTAHSWPSFSPLSRSQSCVRSLACFSPTTLVRVPAVQSLSPLDPQPRSLLPRLARIPRPNLCLRPIHSSAAPSLCSLRMHTQQACPMFFPPRN